MTDILDPDGHVSLHTLLITTEEMRKYGWKVPSEVRRAFPKAWEHIDSCTLCADRLEMIVQTKAAGQIHSITEEAFLALAGETQITRGELTLEIRARYQKECIHLDGCSYCRDLLRLFREQLD